MSSIAKVGDTPFSWRMGLGVAVVLLAAMAVILDPLLGPRFRALCGAGCFVLLTALFSANLRAVSRRTLLGGMLLQVSLILFVLVLGFRRPVTPEMTDQFQATRAVALVGMGPWHGLPALAAEPPVTYLWRPGYQLFAGVGGVVKKFLEFTEAGSRFVFGPLANPEALGQAIPGQGFVFAFSALPTIVFVSSFFAVLFHLGVLQLIVRWFARMMMVLMRTSGAETLSAAANVFMGQTEAPLIVRHYVKDMTDSELLALMVGGMATISGGVMAVYINMGADPVAILATSVMAAPASLYLSKLMLPETEVPRTLGQVQTDAISPSDTVIDAAASGASEGMKLAINIAAMLIAFLAILALLDASLKGLTGVTLQQVFGVAFAPIAYLMGVDRADLFAVGDLLGIKLAANEFVAYVKLTGEYRGTISSRSYALATFALTGFANIASIGIQLGGIGAMAENKRPVLARLGVRALFVGFMSTLVNASLAGVLLPDE